MEVHEGVLYLKGVTWQQMVAPEQLRIDIFRCLHDHRTASHLGIKKTLASIKRQFWWPDMEGDITQWCHQCSPCQHRNPRVGPKCAILQKNPVGLPMERMAMDILSFPTETEDGNTCVLVVCDYFTKWTEAFALPDHQAITVADVLVTEVFLRMGIPRIIHSDKGAEFQSDLISEIGRLVEVKQTCTAPCRPQSDGLVERFNRTLISMLSKLCSGQKDDWDTHLPYVMYAYQASVHESTGCSPNLLMLGWEATLPADLMYGNPQPDKPYECSIQYMEWV